MQEVGLIEKTSISVARHMSKELVNWIVRDDICEALAAAMHVETNSTIH
jgi:hypothetical protein